MDSGVFAHFAAVCRAQGPGASLRVLAASHLEDGRPCFVVEVCRGQRRRWRGGWLALRALALLIVGAALGVLWTGRPHPTPEHTEPAALVMPAMPRSEVAPRVAPVSRPPVTPPKPEPTALGPAPDPPTPKPRPTPRRRPTPNALEPW